MGMGVRIGGMCSYLSPTSIRQICPKHGTDFLEYKCRYCCSVAVFFCFGVLWCLIVV